MHENDNPNIANRTQLIRLIGELQTGHRLTESDVALLHQLIVHTVWLARELHVAEQKIDELEV